MVTLDFTDELAIIIGDDFVYTIEFEDENCEPIDQTGNTFDATITKNGNLIETFGTTISTNSVILSLTDTETTALSPVLHGGRWKLRQTVGTVTTTILTGEVEIKEV